MGEKNVTNSSGAPSLTPGQLALQGKGVAFLGGGCMGGAIALGMVASGVIDADRVLVSHPSAANAPALAEAGVRTFADNREMLGAGAASDSAAQSPEVVILAVKPQVLPAVCSTVADLLAGRLVVSIAAGLSVATLEGLLPGARVVRAMPNLPVAVRSGATAISRGESATDDDLQVASAIFSSVGSARVMREDQLDAEGAVVGCGPAYIGLFVDDMVRSAVEHGLFAADAREMVLTTMRGVATQLLESGDHPRAYMERVTSPGGTTAAGLRAMEPLMFDAVGDAVDAALYRTAELAKGRS